MQTEVKIFPSILAADMGRLAEMSRQAAEAGSDGLHLDIMDGYFVKNISLGFDLIAELRVLTNLNISVHLMVMWPEWYVDRCARLGANTILFHVEARSPVDRTIEAIHRAGARAGLVMNPETPLESILPHIQHCEEVLCMTVHPGFGGQRLISHVLDKISELRKQAADVTISVDGGLDQATSVEVVRRGARVLYVGTHLFNAEDMAAAVARLRQLCGRATSV